MKYVVDRIEGDIVVAVECDTKKVIKIDKSLIDFDIVDGLVITYKNGVYTNNTEETETIKKDIKNRFNKLKK